MEMTKHPQLVDLANEYTYWKRELSQAAKSLKHAHDRKQELGATIKQAMLDAGVTQFDINETTKAVFKADTEEVYIITD